ncbi:hypothetical protein [Bifidobacterium felsineum]|uniref:Uncharacterized protein n=1 Tax=Bifidobacterium felsineum TaxID=2045440 RepID=A0A2M9HJZ5_9BIFI|nr:hypothetical protein [Bifidobacterium felsineum]MBT1165013.1 hypothetical protein [Bifidobacterium felsineum]PJM77129.1 hypothetical protein CSQ86_04295 [Bifidobacterium felsineum]
MGLQSVNYYVCVTWLPTIEVSFGVSADRTGWHLAVFQLVGIVMGLLIPVLLKGDSQVAAVVAAGSSAPQSLCRIRLGSTGTDADTTGTQRPRKTTKSAAISEISRKSSKRRHCNENTPNEVLENQRINPSK